MSRPKDQNARSEEPRADPTADDSLASAIAALNEATETMARVATSRSPEKPSTSDTAPPASAAELEEREAYYRDLIQRGSLVDVADDADLSSLPPTVTHVRYPDGSVERIAYN